MLCDQASDTINSEIVTNRRSPFTRHSYSSTLYPRVCQYPGLRSTRAQPPCPLLSTAPVYTPCRASPIDRHRAECSKECSMRDQPGARTYKINPMVMPMLSR